ncbi:hypothetical protein D9V86_04270 [Bacteroidetes/Chlorobi group bacterium ChocPot_Mid]|nr:MAG: hypothetical protein D9V86_04270 [Bacteroidetes/Chlorobi group bacterium ChocPot_Mid]
MDWLYWNSNRILNFYNILQFKVLILFDRVVYSLMKSERNSNINKNYQERKKFISLINQLFINNKQRYYGTV